MTRKNWLREELIIAFNLYCKIPFTKINATNPAIKELARIIGRSNSSIALKLVNFARLDPALQKRNISGMSHGSKGEEVIWHEFNGNWEELAYESEKILAGFKGNTLEISSAIITDDIPVEGKERESIVKTRVNQSFFRNMVLASYDNHCCITGIAIPALLVASHIIPWATDIKSRMNPANGLCLNALHDQAFDKGLITITPDYILKISDKLIELIRKSESDIFFLPYGDKKINLPQKFLPAKEYLEYHNHKIYVG